MTFSRIVRLRDYGKVLSLRLKLTSNKGWINCGRIDKLNMNRVGDYYVFSIEGSGNEDFHNSLNNLLDRYGI